MQSSKSTSIMKQSYDIEDNDYNATTNIDDNNSIDTDTSPKDKQNKGYLLKKSPSFNRSMSTDKILLKRLNSFQNENSNSNSIYNSISNSNSMDDEHQIDNNNNTSSILNSPLSTSSDKESRRNYLINKLRPNKLSSSSSPSLSSSSSNSSISQSTMLEMREKFRTLQTELPSIQDVDDDNIININHEKKMNVDNSNDIVGAVLSSSSSTDMILSNRNSFDHINSSSGNDNEVVLDKKNIIDPSSLDNLINTTATTSNNNNTSNSSNNIEFHRILINDNKVAGKHSIDNRNGNIDDDIDNENENQQKHLQIEDIELTTFFSDDSIPPVNITTTTTTAAAADDNNDNKYNDIMTSNSMVNQKAHNDDDTDVVVPDNSNNLHLEYEYDDHNHNLHHADDVNKDVNIDGISKISLNNNQEKNNYSDNDQEKLLTIESINQLRLPELIQNQTIEEKFLEESKNVFITVSQIPEEVIEEKKVFLEIQAIEERREMLR